MGMVGREATYLYTTLCTPLYIHLLYTTYTPWVHLYIPYYTLPHWVSALHRPVCLSNTLGSRRRFSLGRSLKRENSAQKCHGRREASAQSYSGSPVGLK